MIGLKSIAKTAIALSASGAVFSGCSSDQTEGALPRQETLYMSGMQWGTPATFNPLAESWMAGWPVSGRFNLVYEPLVTFNTLNGKTDPLLGTIVEELSNNDSIVVDIQPAAKWSDGVPVNSEDVKFMFTKGAVSTSEQISAIHVDTLYAEPAAEDSAGNASHKGKMIGERLSFIVNKAQRNNPLSVRDLLQAIRIAPAHVFNKLIEEKGFDETKKLMMDKNPVVSGPYTIKDYSSNKIILERRDDYWGNAVYHEGKLPAPKYIVHPIYKSNDHITIALREGALDASMSFIPRIWHKKGAGVHTWYNDPPYFVPGAMTMLMINTTKEPLNDKRFRRAMAVAIDYTAIRMFALSNYTTPLQPGLIMPTDLEGKYINVEDQKNFGVNVGIQDEEQRINTVKAMLAEAGYSSKFSDDGELLGTYNAKGEKLPTLFITSPAGWTDWESQVVIAVEGMRKAGIDIREGFVDGGQYWPAMGTGNFDLIMHKPQADVSPSLPWGRFNEVMSSRDWQPLGSWAGYNIGRYNQPGSPEYRPEVDSLLNIIPLATSEEQKVSAYRELNKIFMEDQPSIPLVNQPEQFAQFSERVWTNWPTAENPYAPATLPWVGSATKVLWQLKLAK
ncbi:MAG: ABC transporter substrate-binding protein [Fibrobacter sp.]|nr:ABC transporter substrate-binding protein [Fibrobacter sp.]